MTPVTSPTSPNSPDPPSWPLDSILEDFMVLARGVSEAEDQILIGAVLPMVSRILARRVYIDFAGRKYPNLFNVVVTPPGFRKSTTIDLVQRIGREVLSGEEFFLSGSISDEAMFEAFEREPDRVIFEDEGNTALAFWASHGTGKVVSKRLLKLYDCAPWYQAYMRQKSAESSETRSVEALSCSMILGTTTSNCRFNQLETRDGMRRRVSYYVSSELGRKIYWPTGADGEEFVILADLFKMLRTIKGEMRLDENAKRLWHDYKDETDATMKAIIGVDPASEAMQEALSGEMVKSLKRAMLFQACRHVKEERIPALVIDAESLQCAIDHGQSCLNALEELDRIAERAEIREEADQILAKIQAFGKPNGDGRIVFTRSQITTEFASHPGRRNAMTTDRLYRKVLPDLRERGLARLDRKEGRLEVYSFPVEGDSP